MKCKRFEVFANGVLVDNVVAPWDYTAQDYREDCWANGWDLAPCSETDEIEIREVKEDEV